MLDVSTAALRRWRRENRGPRFVKLGRCVRYLLRDLEVYLEENKKPTATVRDEDAGEFVSIETRGETK
jgi:hypothetical protein